MVVFFMILNVAFKNNSTCILLIQYYTVELNICCMYECPAFAYASRYFFDATAGVMKTVISVQRYE